MHLLQGLAVGLDPAGRGIGHGFKADLGAVFRLQPVDDHVELQGTDNADDPVGAEIRLEDLHQAFFGQILQALAHLLDAHGVGETHAAQDFRREGRQAGDVDVLAFGQRIADAELAVVGHADDVARIGKIGNLAFFGEEEDRRGNGDLLAGTHMFQLHAALERARAQAHEGNPVAVLRVHVGLHLEDKAGDLVFFRHDGAPAGGRLGMRRRCEFGDEVEDFLNAVVAQGRAEEDRRQMAFQKAFLVEGRHSLPRPVPHSR